MNASDYPLTLLYDGACPVCNLEMDSLKARNTRGLLVFVDVSHPNFDPTPYTRVNSASRQDMMALMHAMRPDGSLVVGVAAFRIAYAAVGLGALIAPTGWPLLKPLADAAYKVFAHNRYGFSALFMPVIERIAAARATRRAQSCNDGACATGASNERSAS
jgi:predicted DCC family thiol-disulfide oxidoreductase YuxK